MSDKQIKVPDWYTTADELRFVANKIQTGTYVIGMYRSRAVLRALFDTLHSIDTLEAQGYYDADDLLDNYHRSEEELTQQVMMLLLAAEVYDDRCLCCGRDY